MAEVKRENNFPPVDVGTSDRRIGRTGRYIGRFRGRARVSGNGESECLSDITFSEFFAQLGRKMKNPLPERKLLTLFDLFPPQWFACEELVEYEITVKAKKVTDAPKGPTIEEIRRTGHESGVRMEAELKRLRIELPPYHSNPQNM